jgi:Double zinc ribbon
LRAPPHYLVFVAFASFVLAFVATNVFGGVARAAGLDGQWKQGGLREEYTVQQWLPGCGRAPANGTIGGGEIIAVKEEGDELSFVGGGRVFRTNQCYDEMPTLVRQAHSREGSGRVWRTRCATPPADPRNAVMNALVSVTSDTHIDLVESGRYEITLKEGRCTADVKRTRSFDLVPAAAIASAQPPKRPEVVRPAEPPAKVCATPGEAARLEVRPSKKIVKTGESFGFDAVVRDAKGCATGTATTWSVAPGTENKLTVDGSGKVTVASDAPEGSVDIVVTAAGKSAHVTVEVSSAAHYEALLAQSGDDDEPAVAVIATGSLGGDAARAEGDARRRRNVFIAIVSVIGGALLVIALIGLRRSRRAAAIAREAEDRHAERLAEAEERRREKVAKHAAAQRAHDESVDRATRVAAAQVAEESATQGMGCPACHREFPPQSTFCPADGNRLVAIAGHEQLLAGASGGICPSCKRGFDPGVKTCPDDGDELVPYTVGGSPSGPPTAKGKICPTCGGRFDGTATFCGKDGTALVLLN